MSETQLNKITLRSFFNKLKGFRKLERDHWERTRAQTFLLLSVNFKEGSTLTPQQVFPLPWDVEIKNTIKEDAKKAKERRKKMWAEIDAGKNK